MLKEFLEGNKNGRERVDRKKTIDGLEDHGKKESTGKENGSFTTQCCDGPA